MPDLPTLGPNEPLPPTDSELGFAPEKAPANSADFGTKLRFWLWKYLGTMVMDRKHNGEYAMSLGKSAIVGLLVIAVPIWWQLHDIPESMKQVLFAFLGAYLGHRGIDVLERATEARGS